MKHHESSKKHYCNCSKKTIKPSGSTSSRTKGHQPAVVVVVGQSQSNGQSLSAAVVPMEVVVSVTSQRSQTNDMKLFQELEEENGQGGQKYRVPKIFLLVKGC